MMWLKQSTARILKLGPFVDSTDGSTAETGLTIAQGDIQISKNGAAFAQTSEGSPTTTHDADGWYPIPLTTTDTGTLGTLVVQVAMSGALPVWNEYMVAPANAWDALFGTDKLQVDAVEIDSTAQRATDLAEIAQYLFANTATLTDIIADNAVIAQMLATSGDISDYSSTTDTQEAIRDAITAAAPVAYHPDSSSTINTGNQDANTYADCAADNGTKWTIGDENGDSGAGGSATSDYTIDVTCEFNMGANRVATEVDVNGYFNRSGGGGYVVEVWAYNYTTSSWDKISSPSASEEMQDGSSDNDYVWALGIVHTDPNATPGEVKINFRSTRATTAGGDVLYLDHVQVDGVASGSTSLEAFASAVWEHVIGSTAHNTSAGYFLRTLQALVTDVATGDTATSFTLSDGVATNDAYNGMVIVVKDDTDGHYEARRVEGYTSGLVVTVDRAFSFTPASGDDVDIMSTGYTEAVRGTDSGATAAKLLAYVQLMTRSDAAIATDNATELTAINATGGSGGGDFSNQTDAEEAIKDALATDAQTGATASLVAVNLDHLCKTVTAAADMTTEVVDNTILSRILANGDTSAFVPSTDCLQSIRDALAGDGQTGATAALVAVNLDHLMKTAVASNADMTAEVTDGTVLSNIMTSDSDTSGFAVATDALEAIRDNMEAAVDDGLDNAISSPTANSVAEYLEFFNNVIEGDVTIDTTTTPWDLVVEKKDTSTELIRKKLYTATGTAVSSVTEVIGWQLESAP